MLAYGLTLFLVALGSFETRSDTSLAGRNTDLEQVGGEKQQKEGEELNLLAIILSSIANVFNPSVHVTGKKTQNSYSYRPCSIFSVLQFGKTLL